MPLDARYSLDQTLRLLSIPSPTGYPRKVCSALVETLAGMGFSPRPLRKGGVVCALLHREGYALGNADVTIVAQRPKLRPYIDQMRACLARAMGVEEERISVKATTTEHLGFEGEELGISAHAVCLLEAPPPEAR